MMARRERSRQFDLETRCLDVEIRLGVEETEESRGRLILPWRRFDRRRDPGSLTISEAFQYRRQDLPAYNNQVLDFEFPRSAKQLGHLSSQALGPELEYSMSGYVAYVKFDVWSIGRRSQRTLPRDKAKLRAKLPKTHRHGGDVTIKQSHGCKN